MNFASTLPARLLLDKKCRHIVAPATDVLETPEAYIVSCVMPGLEKDGIRLECVRDELFLEAAASLDPPPGMQVHSLEFCSSLYRLRLALPGDAESAGVSAQYSDGILTLTLPRKKQSLVRRVDVKSGC